MHTHGGWGIEGRGERKEGRGGGGMSKLDAKKGSRKIENTIGFTCFSVGFQIVLKPSLGLSFR
jgi:hypothetical protein